MTGGIRAALFDLGGVIVEIDFNRVFAAWAVHSGVPASVIRSRFRVDACYQAHERGEITAAEYFDSLRASLGIHITDDQFRQGWEAIFVGEVPGVAALLAQAKPLVPLYAFSNTNAAHRDFWARQYAGTVSHFQRVFVSCDLGLRKPEPEAFAAVASAIGERFENILFFDDTRENVESARGLGMHAVHVTGIADVRNALGKIPVTSYRGTPVSSDRR